METVCIVVGKRQNFHVFALAIFTLFKRKDLSSLWVLVVANLEEALTWARKAALPFGHQWR